MTLRDRNEGRSIARFACALLLSGTVIPVTGAWAQEQSVQPDEAGPNEIIVTARGREQVLAKVPVSVSVVSGESLEKANINSLEALSSHVSNVNISSGPTDDQINVRGVGSGQNTGFEQSVATFSDGIYRPRSRSIRSALFDIERVEIMKGPQTIFFGANAIAGALSITTKKPGRQFEYNASGLYGSDNEYQLEGGLTLPASDTLSFRIAGRASGLDGYIDLDDYGKGPDSHDIQGRVSARWTPTDTWTSDLRADYGESKARHSIPWEVVGCPPPVPYPSDPTNICGRFLATQGGAPVDDKLDLHSYSPPSPSKYHFFETAFTNNWEFGSSRVTSITGYYDHSYHAYSHIIPMPIVGSVLGYSGLPADIREKFSQFSQELRVQSDTGGFLDYLAGVYGAHSKLKGLTTGGVFFIPLGAFVSPVFGTNADTPVTISQPFEERTTTLSAFAALTLRPTERIRVNLAARYSSIRKKAERTVTFGTSVNAHPETFAPFTVPGATEAFAAVLGYNVAPFAEPKRTDNEFMPSAGVEFDLLSNVMVYGNYSRGAKAGGYSYAVSPDVFGPEKVDAYEIGAKGRFFDRALFLSVALFRSNYRDLQEAAFVTVGGILQPIVRNAAKSVSQGIEVTATARVSDMLSFAADAAYLDAKYTDFPNAPCTSLGALTPGCVQDVSGKRRAYAPEYSGSVSATLEVPLGDDLTFEVVPSVRYSSSYFQTSSIDPLLRQPSYAKFDLQLRVGSPDGRWSVALLGKNLTDKLTAGFRQDVVGAPGAIEALADRGRSVAIQFTIKQ